MSREHPFFFNRQRAMTRHDSVKLCDVPKAFMLIECLSVTVPPFHAWVHLTVRCLNQLCVRMELGLCFADITELDRRRSGIVGEMKT